MRAREIISEMAYDYEEKSNSSWVFNDKYGNIIGVEFNPINKYFETFYIVKDLNGDDFKVFDFQKVTALPPPRIKSLKPSLL